jgi:RecB family exonuclease
MYNLAMPRKPTLSPTKFSMFLACPSLYYWTYLNEKGRFYLRSKSYFSFGSTLHAVLQKFHDSNDSGVKTVDKALAALEESWIDSGYANSQEMQEAMGEGRTIIERYVQTALAEPIKGTTILVEKRLRMEMGQFDLLGQVDRVDEYPDGAIEIVDYKSGRETVTVEDVAGDLAMGCYQLLLAEKFPDREIRARIIALRTNSSACASLSPDQRAEFREDLMMLGSKILNRNWDDTVPQFKSICHKCDFQPLCRKGGLIVPTDQ